MTTKTIDTSAILMAEADIRRTLFHYFRLADTMEGHRIPDECFAPDAVMSYSTFDDTTSISGLDEIRKFYKEHLESDDYEAALERSLHIVGGTAIDWDGDKPTLRATVLSLHWYRRNAAAGSDRVVDKAVVGFEEADLTEVDGSWLFQRRAVEYKAAPIVNYSPV